VITTTDLIESLAASMTPVQRLWPPLIRAGCWLLLAAVILGLLAVSEGIRPDLLQRLQHAHFTVGMAASLLTGMSAAIAAFMLSLPDRSRLWLLLPAPALLGWLSTLGYQCLTDWISLDPTGIRLGETIPMLCDIGAHRPTAVADDAGHAAVCRAAAPHGDDVDGQSGRRGKSRRRRCRCFTSWTRPS
jgi:hypothetical protein